MAGSHTGCGCMTSRTGCLIIGWLEVVIIIPAFLLGAVLLTLGLVGIPNTCSPSNSLPIQESIQKTAEFYWKHEDCKPTEDSQMFIIVGVAVMSLCALYLFAPCCLIHGASNQKPSFLVAYIVCGVLKNILGFVSVVVSLISLRPEIVILSILFFAIDVWKTVVVWCHYNYIAEKPKGDNEMLVNKGAYVNF